MTQSRERQRAGGRMAIVALCAASLSCIPPRQSSKSFKPDRSWTRPEHLVPTESNLVARVDWKRADARVRSQTLAYAQALGFDPRLFDTLEGCLAEAETVWIGMRVGREGFLGDALVIAETSRDKAPIPCYAKGWREAGTIRETALFEPEVQQGDRKAPGLLVRDPIGLVLVASTGQMDAVLRILRSGPDQSRLDPSAEPLVAVEARLGPDAIPDGLRGRSPPVADLARGIENFRMNLDVAQSVKVRVALTYDDAPRAKGAGELLANLRTSLLKDEKPDWRAAAQSAHASVLDNVVKVSFEVPREMPRNEPQGPTPHSSLPTPKP